MKTEILDQHTRETVLKLTLLNPDSRRLAAQLAMTAPLRPVQATKQTLHEVYYDTPDLTLHQHRMALCIRCVGKATPAACVQTLTIHHPAVSALSVYDKWEDRIPGKIPKQILLQATPWPKIDPDGHHFDALTPCFARRFVRTQWQLTIHNSVIHVTLDLGRMLAGKKTDKLCNLELKLLSGEEVALFDVAQKIARSIAVLPSHQSYADLGHALIQDTLDRPHYAQPPALPPKNSLVTVAQAVLREMLVQFAANLNTLRRSDDPEVVHQTRVGWRRFKSALRLFRPVLACESIPSLSPLKGVLNALGVLRDLDVALTDTLPPMAEMYITSDPTRALNWAAMVHSLGCAAQRQRQTVRNAMMDPQFGKSVLAIAQFVEELSPGNSVKPTATDGDPKPLFNLRHWTRKRLGRWSRKLKATLACAEQPDQQHRARILAKHLRYSTEVLQNYLPARRAKRWIAASTRLQTTLGTTRDHQRVLELLNEREVDPYLLEFLRGYCCGLGKHN
jgi:inorganic triphosphatase YgiF